jgi:hypothetical protein
MLNRMGAGQTKPLGGVSRQELLQKTAGTQRIVHEMFQEMITRLTPEDFLKLGNPQTCNKFIFMMADTLYKLFTALRIRPKRQGDSGVVLFEDADILRKPTPETKKLCLYIAYFYIRIFQIFGALTLTVLDDPSAGPILDITRIGAPAVAPRQVGLFGRVAQPQIQYGVRATRPQMGGADPASFTGVARYFSFMSSLFMEPYNNEFAFADDANFVLAPAKKEYNFYILLENNIHLYAQLTPGTLAVRGMERSAKLQFTKFFYSVPSGAIGTSLVDNAETLKRINAQLRYIKYEFIIESNDGGRSWYSKKTNQQVIYELEKMRDKILGYIKQIGEKKMGVIKDGKVVQFEQLAQAGMALPGAVGQREDPFVTKALQNQYIINTMKAMSTNKPVAYCVARALQLIDADTLFSRVPKPAQSSVCFATFQSRPGSAPKDGTSLDAVLGLRTLDHLYYTHPTFDQDKRDISIDVNDKQEYADFLQKMGTLFGKPAVATPNSLSDIKATANPACIGQAANKYLQIADPRSVATIIKVVNQMFKRQLEHTQKVMGFFKSYLFVIGKSKNPMTGETRFEYRLNPKLLAGGLQGIDNVSKLARQLLLDYYTNCETTYQEGVRLVLQLRTA